MGPNQELFNVSDRTALRLEELYRLLRKKEGEYSEPGFKTIFDLDDEKSPVRFPELLIKFDEIKKHPFRVLPIHTTGSKYWKEAKHGKKQDTVG